MEGFRDVGLGQDSRVRPEFRQGLGRLELYDFAGGFHKVDYFPETPIACIGEEGLGLAPVWPGRFLVDMVFMGGRVRCG